MDSLTPGAGCTGEDTRPMRRLRRNAGWTVAATVIASGSLVAETVLVGGYLGAAGLGVVALVFAYPETIQQLGDFRVRDAMTRYLSAFLARGERPEAVALIKLLWLLDAAVGLLTLLVVLASAGLAASLFVPGEDVRMLMILAAVGLFFGSLDSASGTVLRVVDRFRLAAVVGSACALARAGLVFAALAAGGGLEAVVWARVAAELLTTLVQGAAAVAVLRPELGPHSGTPIRLLQARYGEILRFALSTSLVGSLKLVSSKVGTLLVGALSSPSTVGLYRIAVQFGTAPQVATDALQSTVYPDFARAGALGEVAHIRRIVLRGTLAVTVVALPVLAAAAVFTGPILDALVGEEFRAAGTATFICLAGIFPAAALFWLYPLLLTLGHATTFLKLHAVVTLVHLGALPLLVPPLGATGASLCLAGAYLLSVGLQLQLVVRRGLLRDEAWAGATA